MIKHDLPAKEMTALEVQEQKWGELAPLSHILYYTIVPLPQKCQKWRLSRFAIKLFIYIYIYRRKEDARQET